MLMEKSKKPVLEIGNRAAQVLADVVETYGTKGEPVGSKALVQSGKYQLSGASIRNVMQDLEGMGLIKSPHTSAGRIPTEMGYRYYAQHLVETTEPEEAVKQAIQSQINPSKSLSQLTKDVTSVLSQVTNCAALVTAPKRENDTLETMEFIRLSNNRVLVVMVTKSGEIENRMMEVPEFISADDLKKAASTLNPFVMGHTLEEAKAAMLVGMAEQRGQVNAMIDQMMQAANEWGQPVTADGAMVVAGSTNLFQYPEIVRDKLQGLIKVFEEKRLLMTLVDEVRTSNGVKIFVGGDVPVIGAEDLAVIASPYGHKAPAKDEDSRKLVGTVGVIGPMRMDYKHTMGVVDYTRSLLDAALK
ncbi:MAG: heat-inducible transcription repressor HrcA [Blastochloris viridis]|uniref:Heat-inducible transcription repressor HrcA n=1 Tax=Blastochloris viridis TaxID=1079 RepID=A0A6N4RFT9_BLAVI|nr:MAG: heat-inducible transcription repressor HrcA [Blastochloris viridis]